MARVMEKPVVTRRTTTKPRSVKRSTQAVHRDLTPEERYRLIAETAYFIAEKRGFQPGDQLQDWLEAEKKVDEACC